MDKNIVRIEDNLYKIIEIGDESKNESISYWIFHDLDYEKMACTRCGSYTSLNNPYFKGSIITDIDVVYLYTREDTIEITIKLYDVNHDLQEFYIFHIQNDDTSEARRIHTLINNLPFRNINSRYEMLLIDEPIPSRINEKNFLEEIKG